MVTLAIALLIVVAVAFVAYPLLVPTSADDGLLASPGDMVFENLLVQRDTTYSAIKDLDNDRAMGKLSDAEYKSLRGKYEAKAVTILQELDGYQAAHRAPNDDEVIERQVQRLRNGAATRIACSKCGTRAAASDRFCAKCGTRLKS